MRSADVLECIERMGELPILPHTLLSIQTVASDSRSSAEDLAEVILKDEALTMRVLKVVNSSFYSRRCREQVRTISRAVVVLGFETVRMLALGLSVFDMMSKLSRSPYLMDLTRHSILVAAFAQKLAEVSGTVPAEEAFVVALIHDVGKVVLIDCAPEEYDRVRRLVEQGEDIIDAERRVFGIAHPRAGRKLAARWNLPADLQALISDHHDFDPLEPPRRMDPMAAVLLYADTMSRFASDGQDHRGELKLLRLGARVLGIPTAAMEDLYADAKEYLVDFAERMGAELGELGDYATLVAAQRAQQGLESPDPAELVRRTALQLALYQDLGRLLSEGRGSEEILVRIVEGAHEVLGFERVILLRCDDARKRLHGALAAGPGGRELAAALELPLARASGAVALCVLDRRAYHVPMARSEAYGEMAGQELLEISHSSSFATAPVRSGPDVVAVLWADLGPDGPAVSSEMAAELEALSAQASLALVVPV